MKEKTTAVNQLVIIQHKQALTTSRIVAEHFHKQHKHVIRDIENLIEQMASVHESPKLGSPQKMFYEHSYTVENNTKVYKEYLMNRDGFTLLAMGFTGKKALQFKLDYINAFNAMEAELNRIANYHQNAEWIEVRKDTKLLQKELHDAIKDLVEYARAQGSQHADKLYMNYNRLINKVAYIDPKSRDQLPAATLYEVRKLISMVEVVIKGLMSKGENYKVIYQQAKATLNDYARIAMIKPEYFAIGGAVA